MQAIGQLRYAFLCGIPTIASVCNFYGQKKFLKVKISCKDMLDAHISIDGAWGVPVTRIFASFSKNPLVVYHCFVKKTEITNQDSLDLIIIR